MREVSLSDGFDPEIYAATGAFDGETGDPLSYGIAYLTWALTNAKGKTIAVTYAKDACCGLSSGDPVIPDAEVAGAHATITFHPDYLYTIRGGQVAYYGSAEVQTTMVVE